MSDTPTVKPPWDLLTPEQYRELPLDDPAAMRERFRVGAEVAARLDERMQTYAIEDVRVLGVVR